ncbi:MAG: hypothetical protein QW175_00900 [Candidatus Bathyarchaeia archaeon]
MSLTAEKKPNSGWVERLDGDSQKSLEGNMARRETYRETVIAIMKEARELTRKTLIEKAIARNPTISKRPKWVYTNVIRGLKRDGILEEPVRGKIIYKGTASQTKKD